MVLCDNNNLSCFFKGYPDVVGSTTDIISAYCCYRYRGKKFFCTNQFIPPLELYQLLQLKSKLSGGIKCDAVNKIYLGQLLAYIIGIVLMDIQKVVDLTQPWLRIYMEESKVRTLH